MSTPVLIFSRIDSERLPGKALLPVAGRPLLARVIDRVRLSTTGPIVGCTSERECDEPIAQLAAAEGVESFRGATDDVLARALACVEELGVDNFVRISGDSPFMDGQLIDRFVASHLAERPDLTTNICPRTFPYGVSIEVISTATLQRVAALTSDAEDREHVTRYLYAHAANFRIRNEAAEDNRYAGIVLTVDSPADLARTEWIAERLATDAGLDEVVDLAREYLRIGKSNDGESR